MSLANAGEIITAKKCAAGDQTTSAWRHENKPLSHVPAWTLQISPGWYI